MSSFHELIRVLLIEDSPGDAVLLQEELAGMSRINLTVSHAATLSAGMELIRRQHFDAILLDLGLPDSDGLQTLQSIQTLARTIPIVIVTGWEDEQLADEAIHHGAQDYLIKGTFNGRSFARSIRYAIDRKRVEEALRSSEESLRQAHNELERLASTDSLTGLYNRRHFDQLAQGEVARSNRYGHFLAMIMLDIDHFKQVNDLYGHSAGDQVLALIAACCRRELRSVDLAGRYGGDEFVILLPETGPQAAEHFAERFRLGVMNNPIDLGNGPLTVTVSIGLASFKGDGLTLEVLQNRADQALYVAKRCGRNRVSNGSTGAMK
jgi:diguanylate cyclase (GGDEF)-like protein